MSKADELSEKKIIKYIKDEIENEIDTFHWFDNTPDNATRKQIEESIKAHQGLLDLYTKEKEKEKEKNKELDSENIRIRATLNEVTKDYISKDKIKEKIKECKKAIKESKNNAQASEYEYQIEIYEELLKKEG